MHNSTIDHLAALAAQVDDVLDRVLDDEVTARCTDGDLITVLTLVGRLGRRIDALAVEATGAVIDRSRTGDIDARLTTRFGCHDVSELLQRTTLISPQTAGRWQRSARLVHREISITTGEVLPPMFPAMRGALLAGDVGIDGLLAVAGPLSDLDRRVDHSAVRAADTALAAAARGEGPDQSPPACADLLKVHASAWAAALDQDGAEPRERQAVWRRFLTLGRLRDGIVPIRGGLLPEVAAQLQRIMDAVGSPRVAGDTGGVRFVPEGEAPGATVGGDSAGATVGESAGGDSAASDDLGADRGATNAVGDTDDETLGLGLVPPDERRAGQRRHDALATALFAATASELLPTIGGAAPTLVVATLESDLINDRGVAHIDGSDAPLHIAAARHLACTGVIQRISLARDGRILRLGTEERVFNRHQRRAIALRDGGCIIPGCGVPAAWCEIHHVHEWAEGGPTHTDNGVLLCWFHHRFLDSHGWAVRITRGVPEVRAPRWNDGSGRWRAVTRSKLRLTQMIVRRT